MSVTAVSTPNIALIKYWGNRNNELRLPAADSLSMTLDSPTAEITVDHADQLSVRSYEPDGSERRLLKRDTERFKRHLALTKRYLAALGIESAIPQSTSISIRSAIPPRIGLASSAAVFSGLAQAYAGCIVPTCKLTQEQIGVIARFGAGSASRSVFGGFSALIAGSGEEIDSAKVVQIADEKHWQLHDIVIVPSQEEKEIGSTEGHALAWTSPQYKTRLINIPRRQRESIEAIEERDFEKLQKNAEEDCMDMHQVMQTSTPALQYLSDETYRIIREVESMRKSRHLPILYTMDAGPTVHLICTDEAREAMVAYAHAQKGCTIFETKVGKGAQLTRLHV